MKKPLSLREECNYPDGKLAFLHDENLWGIATAILLSMRFQKAFKIVTQSKMVFFSRTEKYSIEVL